MGLGGGVLLVPVLTLWLGVPIHHTIGASIVAVIGTSSAAASAYLDDRLTNIKLAMTLETATTAGAVLGGVVATLLSRQVLSSIFAAALTGVAYTLLRRKGDQPARYQGMVTYRRLGGCTMTATSIPG